MSHCLGLKSGLLVGKCIISYRDEFKLWTFDRHVSTLLPFSSGHNYLPRSIWIKLCFSQRSGLSDRSGVTQHRLAQKGNGENSHFPWLFYSWLVGKCNFCGAELIYCRSSWTTRKSTQPGLGSSILLLLQWATWWRLHTKLCLLWNLYSNNLHLQPPDTGNRQLLPKITSQKVVLELKLRGVVE